METLTPLGIHPPVVHPAPNFSPLLAPTLSSVYSPQTDFSPLCFLWQRDSTSSHHCELDLRMYSLPLFYSLHSLSISSSILPATPTPQFLSRTFLFPHIHRCSSGLILFFLDHCPSLHGFVASSLSLMWPQKCLSSSGMAPIPHLLRALPRHPRALGQIPGIAW